MSGEEEIKQKLSADADNHGEDEEEDDILSESSDSNKNCLTEELIRKNLHMIKRQANNDYGYSKLEVMGELIDCIDDRLNKYIALESINLSNNNIADLSPLHNMPNLIHFNAQSNRIKQLHSLKPQAALQILELDNNLIEHFCPILHGELFAFSAANNNINNFYSETADQTNINNDHIHKKLQILDLSNNELSSISSICLFPNLRVLNLSGNNLTSIAGIESLNKLYKIDLANNKLTGLPTELNRLNGCVELKSLSIGGNDDLLTEMEEFHKVNENEWAEAEELAEESSRQRTRATSIASESTASGTTNRTEGKETENNPQTGNKGEKAIKSSKPFSMNNIEFHVIEVLILLPQLQIYEQKHISAVERSAAANTKNKRIMAKKLLQKLAEEEAEVKAEESEPAEIEESGNGGEERESNIAGEEENSEILSAEDAEEDEEQELVEEESNPIQESQ